MRRLSEDETKLEAILDELGDRVDSALPEGGCLMYHAGGDAFHALDR